MKIRKSILLCLSISGLLIATGCNNNPGGGGGKPTPPDQYQISLEAVYASSEPITITYNINKDYLSFENKGTEVNKGLALMSFASITHSNDKAKTTSFYEEFEFDNFYYSPDFDVPEDENSVLYTIAHKKDGDNDIIAININGTAYNKPWKNNAVIGKEGNASGYQLAADKVLPSVTTYLSSYDIQNVKFWITGYSRGGAISNILAYTLLETLEMNEDNMYCYTFETPGIVDVNNVKEHQSIHNIISRKDIFTHLFPSSYGLSRVGLDHVISNQNLDNAVKELDSRLSLPAFTKDSDYSDESAFIEYMISFLTNPTSEKSVDMSTREHYVDNMQDHIAYLLYLFRTLQASTMSTLKDKFMEIYEEDPSAIFQFLQEDKLYEFVAPILDDCGEQYEADTLKAALNQIVKFVTTNILNLYSLMSKTGLLNNCMRVGYGHSLEVVLALLVKTEF